jgi:hypothetical protein
MQRRPGGAFNGVGTRSIIRVRPSATRLGAKPRVTNHTAWGRVNTGYPGEDASSDDRLFLPRLLATGSMVLTTATFRTCLRSLKLCGEHSASLIRLTADYTSGSPSAPTSRQVLRDELLGLMRELAGVAWHESRRAIDELDLRTRSGCMTSEQPTRPHRVKS